MLAGPEPVLALARGDVPAGGTGIDVSAQGPDAWRVRCEHDGAGFDATFAALGPEVATPGGGTERLCRVTGTATGPRGRTSLACLGQRSTTTADPDWASTTAHRTLTAWLPDGTAIALTATRPAGGEAAGTLRDAPSAGGEAAGTLRDAPSATGEAAGATPAGGASDVVWAALLGERGAAVVDEPRLSTTYDGNGRQRRAGLELRLGDGEPPLRVSGEAVGGSTLDLGRLRLDAAIFRWRAAGRTGIGRYDVWRRVRD